MPSGMTTQGHFVCAGGPADGRLVPGDQLVKINNVSADDLTPEQAAEIIRSAQTAALTNTLTHTHTRLFVHSLLDSFYNNVMHIISNFLLLQGVSRYTGNDSSENNAGKSFA